MFNKIPEDKLMNVCKLGQGAKTCAYITFSAVGGFSCAKACPILKATIDERLKAGLMNARGNNCSGNDK